MAATKEPVPPKVKKLSAVFYKNSRGAEPVRDWLLKRSTEDRKIIGEDIATVEFGWPVGMPTCRSLGKGLWEVRSNITDGIARVIFFIHAEQLVLLDGFVKKTQRTPEEHVKRALDRRKEVEGNVKK